MKSQIVLAATMAALMLSPAAFAGSTKTTPSENPAATNHVQLASMTPAEQCAALQGQWQAESPTLKGHAKYAQAQDLFGQGQQLCQTHKERNEKDGAATLGRALELIGLKPKA